MDVLNIKVEKICPSPLNPRKTFDQSAIEELAGNIEKQGLLQPITVRVLNKEVALNEDIGEVIEVPGLYEIICGERRYRAFLLLKEKEDSENIEKVKNHRKKTDKYQTIPCIVREMTDDEAFDAMITENLQRQDVDPIEEAFAFSQLLEKGNTVEDIAIRFGKSNRFVFDRVKLNSLIPEYKKMLKDNMLPISGAMMLAKLTEEEQTKLLEDLTDDDSITVGDIKSLIDDMFMNLDNALWAENDTWPNNEFKICKECQCNTANHGCLFYEMNNKGQKCTNRECYRNKTIGYVLKKLGEESNLVKAGESLDFGKTVVIKDKIGTYASDEAKLLYEKIYEKIESLGYKVVDPNECFKFKSRANEDQLKEKNRKQRSLPVHRSISI